MIDWELAKQLWNEPNYNPPIETPKENQMVKRTYNLPEEEPEQSKFEVPSAKEHLFQIVDVYTSQDEIGQKLKLDDNTVSAKCEVVGGEEEGRNVLVRASLDEGWKGFFFTKMLLKAIGEPYKGQGIEIDTDRWIGRQFYATVKHDGKYANISEYNFDKKIEQAYKSPVGQVADPADIVWNE